MATTVIIGDGGFIINKYTSWSKDINVDKNSHLIDQHLEINQRELSLSCYRKRNSHQ